jgi:VanZ family protein
MKPLIRYYFPAFLWAALIFSLSSIPRLTPPPVGIKLSDKVYHFIEFAIFGLFLIRAFRHLFITIRPRTAILWAVLCGVLWGILDEVHQLFVSGREASLWDALADATGVIVVAAVAWWWSLTKGFPEDVEERSADQRRIS